MAASSVQLEDSQMTFKEAKAPCLIAKLADKGTTVILQVSDWLQELIVHPVLGAGTHQRVSQMCLVATGTSQIVFNVHVVSIMIRRPAMNQQIAKTAPKANTQIILELSSMREIGM